LREAIIMLRRDKDYAIAQHDFVMAATLRQREHALRREVYLAEDAWYASQQQVSPVINEHDIASVVAAWTGIPVTELATDETDRLLHLEDELHRHVVGQHQAVQALARAVRRSRTNLRDSRRPIGSFLFVGPTGVGKTALARALATTLFGDERAMLKLDMSEFMESHHVTRLIGAPPGYAGYEGAGQLTEAVRRRPYSIVLFDEIEKAHPKVFDLLLQILEEGRLTDSHGQEVDFRHTILIITSNLGTGQLTQGEMKFFSARHSQQEHYASAYERASSAIMPALKATLKPELLNRIDEIIIFHALGAEHMIEIVYMLIAQLQERLAAQSIELQVSQEARLLLARRGYDLEYGARFLRRVVQHLLEDPLAEALLQGTFVPGNAVQVDTSGEALYMEVARLHANEVVSSQVELRKVA
jgi:ATP-dependent Clp protease ATP-binding subunit ClpC